MIAERSTQGCLGLAALVHLLPLPGVLGSAVLGRLYGLKELDAATTLLLQHRAVLFGLLALPLLIAIRVPAWRLPAASLGLLSVLSFLTLAWFNAQALSTALWRVVWADLVVLPMLLWVLLRATRVTS